MTALAACIVVSAFIFIIFRLFPKFGVDTFQAIVFNYLTASACGFLLYGDLLTRQALAHTEWMPFSAVTGFLFISLFLAIGISAQQNGVAMTSVSVKMSMALPVVLMIVLYSEPLSLLKVAGIALAIAGVLAVSWPGKEVPGAKPIVWLLVLLFIGSGILDFMLNYVQNYQLEFLPSPLFGAFSFGVAFGLGALVLIVDLIRKKRTFSWKNVCAGICLGIPNFFSVYLLMRSYSSVSWTDSSVLAVMNVSIVLLSAFAGFILFRESFSRLRLIGLVSAVGAILLLYLASL